MPIGGAIGENISIAVGPISSQPVIRLPAPRRLCPMDMVCPSVAPRQTVKRRPTPQAPYAAHASDLTYGSSRVPIAARRAAHWRSEFKGSASRAAHLIRKRELPADTRCELPGHGCAPTRCHLRWSADPGAEVIARQPPKVGCAIINALGEYHRNCGAVGAGVLWDLHRSDIFAGQLIRTFSLDVDRNRCMSRSIRSLTAAMASATAWWLRLFS